MDPVKISTMLKWTVPDSRNQLKQFLGFANVYRHSVRNYGSVAAPLTMLTSVKKPFVLSPGTYTHFQALKEHFTLASTLQMPDQALL